MRPGSASGCQLQRRLCGIEAAATTAAPAHGSNVSATPRDAGEHGRAGVSPAIGKMEKRFRRFKSHAEADAADKTYYHSLTPQQRLNILLELIARGTDESEQPPVAPPLKGGRGDVLESSNARNVEYLIVGAHAMAYHGYPRFTGDLDVFVRVSDENAAKLKAVIDKFGFADTGLAAADFQTPDLVIQLGVAPNRVDIMTFLSGVTFDEAWGAREEAELGGVAVPVLDKLSSREISSTRDHG
jgi:hypothetical protein